MELHTENDWNRLPGHVKKYINATVPSGFGIKTATLDYANNLVKFSYGNSNITYTSQLKISGCKTSALHELKALERVKKNAYKDSPEIFKEDVFETQNKDLTKENSSLKRTVTLANKKIQTLTNQKKKIVDERIEMIDKLEKIKIFALDNKHGQTALKLSNLIREYKLWG